MPKSSMIRIFIYVVFNIVNTRFIHLSYLTIIFQIMIVFRIFSLQIIVLDLACTIQ